MTEICFELRIPVTFTPETDCPETVSFVKMIKLTTTPDILIASFGEKVFEIPVVRSCWYEKEDKHVLFGAVQKYPGALSDNLHQKLSEQKWELIR